MGKRQKVEVDGIEYKSISEACKAYNVQVPTCFNRLKKGYSIEEALKPEAHEILHECVEDHLGNKFNTFKSMCDFYKLDRSTVQTRLKSGLTLEEALTKEIKDKNTFIGPDGKEYNNLAELCKKHNKKITLVKDRIRLGWTLEEALSKPIGNIYKDHLGNEYDSLNKLCNEYNITVSIYRRRESLGWSLEEILTTPCKRKGERKVCDHLGNEYKSLKHMCGAYEISTATFESNQEKGYSLEDSLKKKKTSRGIEVTDHLGNKYDSFKEMCTAYGLALQTVKSRLNKGQSLEQALTTPLRNTRIECYDHLGNRYDSVQEMCKVYGIAEYTFLKRLKYNWTLEKALTTKLKNYSQKVIDSSGVEYKSISEACKCHKANKNYVLKLVKSGMTIQEALDYKRSHIEFRGKTYNTLSELAREFNRIPSRVQYLYKQKHKTLEEALELDSEIKNEKSICITIDGVTYKTISDACRTYGISPSVFIHRREKLGMSVDEALKTPVGMRKKKVILNVGTFDNLVDCCAKLDISYSVAYKHLKNGGDLEDIINWLLEMKKNKKDIIDHQGVKYNSLAEMCKKYGICYSTYNNRIKQGWKQADALMIPTLKYKITKEYIGIDEKQYYKIKTPDKTYYLNAQQIVEYNKQGLFDR